MQRRIARHHLPYLFTLSLTLIVTLAATLAAVPAQAAPSTGTYTNPLPVTSTDGGLVENCPDPSVIRGQQPGDPFWYMYCTGDPLNDEDRHADGAFNFPPIPMFRSLDLVNWTYAGDAFSRPGDTGSSPMPSWAEPTSNFWAPEISYFNDQYYLYYTVPDVKAEVSGAANCGADAAIGVATSASPLGPWTDSGTPIIQPRYNGPVQPFGQRTCRFFSTIDPEVIIAEDGKKYFYWGSYNGGIFVRELLADGLTADPGTEKLVTTTNRYEGAEIVFRDGYYYLFASSTNCCNGPVTGYSVFVGRSTSPTGEFVDREGVSLLAGRTGGTPVLSMNGNRWVGTGHNTVLKDFAGQYWTIYHAADRNDPYFAGTTNFTKRPALMDALDWIDGWPTVRGGQWASDTPQQAPAAQPGDKSQYETKVVNQDVLGPLIEPLSDDFESATLNGRWTWVREPVAGTYGVEAGAFRFATQAGNLVQRSNSASVLTEPAPYGNYVVETRVKLNVPDDRQTYNAVQAGLVIYGDDNNYLKLTHVATNQTRRTEFGKEYSDATRIFSGDTNIGPVADWTYLRIVKRTQGGEEHYTAYTSRDGQSWVRGGTWTHMLGKNARIGLVSMGRTGFTANFDYVRVYEVDTIAPETSIDKSPSTLTRSTSASFEFSSSEANSTFECQLDGAAFARCTSPQTASGLADGSHTFAVRASDAAGNTDATAATSTWTVDATAPTLAWNAAGDTCSVPGNAGWCRGTQTASFTASDATSGLANAPEAAFTRSTSDNGSAVVIASGAVCDVAGNCAASVDAGPYKIDSAAPTLQPTVSPNPVLLNGSATANPNAADSLSSVESSSCGAADTRTVGAKTVACQAIDAAGNTASAAASYNVSYNFGGFLQPVDNLPAMNVAKAGQAVPLKWRLTDANNNAVTNLSSVTVTAATLSCSTGTTTDQVEEYAAGASGLQNLGNGYYQFNWKTPTTYAGLCKTLQLDVGEGALRTANFNFTK
jgi:arabinan endo-1,5-alpha-L-arabinosidase